MTRLGVNVDHIATIREARKTNEPDPVDAALRAEAAGAHGITIHLRGDRRHIQERDLKILRETVKTRLNVEMACTQEMVKIAYTYKPDIVTFVPERREEVSTEGGLDVVLNQSHIKGLTASLHEAGIEVSLFIDPDKEQIGAANQVDADAVEINTAAYSEARSERDQAVELEKIALVTRRAQKLGLKVLAGHGLDYRNVTPVSTNPEIEELNIGHSIISRATLVGIDQAVREMLALMNP
ncbi:pyridoxine 5'-phosphate synthase [Acidobacteriota bacterium]